VILEGDRNIVGKASVVSRDCCCFLGIFLEVYFVASSWKTTRDELVEGDSQELDNAGERQPIRISWRMSIRILLRFRRKLGGARTTAPGEDAGNRGPSFTLPVDVEL